MDELSSRIISPVHCDIPTRGMIFTSTLGEPAEGKRDFRTFRFKNITGYVHNSYSYGLYTLKAGERLRLKVIDDPVLQEHHRHFRAIPFRPLYPHELDLITVLAPKDFLYLEEHAFHHCTPDPRFTTEVLMNDYYWLLTAPQKTLLGDIIENNKSQA